MGKQTDRFLSEALLQSDLLPKEQLEKVLFEVQRANESLENYLIRHGLITQAQILSLLSSSLHIETVDLKHISIDKSTIEKIPIRFVGYYKFMPVKIENRLLTMAVSAPPDVKVLDEIRIHLGFEPKIVLASEADIVEAIKRNYGLGADTIDQILTKDPVKKSALLFESEKSVEDIEKKTEDASIIKLVNQIILEAYKKRATDIHVEPYRDKVRFRYRIDGVLVDANLPADVRHFLLPILSRIKIMANLSIVEKRLPQDGSAVVKTKDEVLDLRVSTIPTPNGESMVIRILPKKVMLFSLEEIGLNQRNVEIFRALIKKPHGIIFVTGPTGSGKTTTLYACLNEINSSERKIITIEDPIEYEMEGITQIQVNSKVSLDFARGLRSVLRHDPDIIMVGEVRDLETAEIAIRTALTGHLVFSTLHTNDAASGATRLIEMGLEPYLVASSIEAFVAQRLVRKICVNCKEEMSSPFPDVKKEISEGLHLPIDTIKFYKGKGCDYCNGTGFYGRTTIHEILVMNDALRSAILEKPRADYVKQMALKSGMVTLRQDGWQKVINGITTPGEVLNVTSKEEFTQSLLGAEEPLPTTVSVGSTAMAKPLHRAIPKNILSVANEYESRVYARVTCSVPIRYKIFQDVKDEHENTIFKTDNFEHSTVTKDINAGGLLFVSHHSLSLGSILELKIQLEEKKTSVDCLAKVCRIEEDDRTNLFNIAVYYLDITSADRVKVSDFVKLKSEERKKT